MSGLLGGAVSVRSEPRQGSRFTIEIPWKPLEPEPSTDVAALDTTADSSPTATALAGTLFSHSMISAALAELGIHSMFHPFSLDVLPRIRSLQPSLIVLENLPGDPRPMELVRRISGDPDEALLGVHVLLISEDIEVCELAGQERLLRLPPPVTRVSLQLALAPVLPMTSGDCLAMILVSDRLPSAVAPVILLAEDNVVNARSVVDFLKTKGMRPVLASDGDEAVRRALELRPRAILMDIQMPGRDGLDAIRLIKSNRQTMGIPIIALTALAMPGDRDRCLAAGADAYLSKPVVLHDLYEVLCRLMKRDQRGSSDNASGIFDQPDIDCG